MNGSFAGKVALVTGGTGGLGGAVSVAFLEADAKVVVTYVRREEFARLQSVAGAKGSSIEGHSVDVTDEAAARGLVSQIVAKHGRLDILVNAVGGYAGGVKLWDVDTTLFERMLALNLRTIYALSKSVVPAMLKQKYGAVVNVAAKAALDHGAGASAYAASKAAAVAMIDSLAEDLRGSGVRVNSILPSIIDTEANRRAMPDSDFAKWPKPEALARVILFLCSDDAKVIHGASIPVYGEL